VLIAAAIFGAGHAAQGIVGAVAAGVLGIGFGLIMLLHRSIWPAVLAHGFFNATSFVLIPYVMEWLQRQQ
jgi:membrane protease YdiL (CAAX protease family)